MTKSRVEDVLPLTPLQEGLLFHALFDGQAPDVYTVQLGVDLDGTVDPAAMRAAARALIRRNPALRAAFRHEGVRRPVQVIAREVEAPFREVDLRAFEEEEREARLTRLLTDERSRRFDLTRPPLFRLLLVHLGERSSRLVLTNHHILLDGWSMPLVLAELFALYERSGDDSGLPAAVPHRAHLQWLADRDQAAARRAWSEALAGFEEPTLLAPDTSGGTSGGTTGGAAGGASALPEQLRAELRPGLTDALSALARRLGVTVNTVVQGAWGLLLSRLTGRRDAVFGATASGRSPELPGADRMIGLFINTLPVRVRWCPEESVAEVLNRLQEEQSRLLPHQHIGLTELQLPTASGNLFDTIVVFENYPLDRSVLNAVHGDVRLTGAEITDATHYPLALFVIPGSRFLLRLDHQPALIDPATADRLLKRLVGLLEAIVENPEQPVGRLDVLTPEERHDLLVGWNDTSLPVAEALVPELFEAQVARTPDATALVCDDTVLSYAELNTR
ncbi:condensation domain-containing protein, partial [Kitasatospora sp. NPDC092286]|uniref:condensation domain-containing protein n=1 Tax=Kitasatospora sp. NPDC092286 TaxID=3364087 RepID=UPI0038145CD0